MAIVDKKKCKVDRLFELQTSEGIHIAWCCDEDSVKYLISHRIYASRETRVYQYIGSFEPVVQPTLVWKKLVR